MKLTRLGWVAVLVFAGLAGCGGDGRINAKGRVIKAGQPYTVPEGDYVRVTFYELTPDGANGKNSYAATFNNADGTFRAVGPDGRGIPPGKYRVCVEHERKRRDLFRGAYNTDTTPYVFDVDSRTKELLIDLDRRS
ncbi:MAG: hypothetical protein J2P46_15935 [Zavarzinella sp.]|nr:hypothetical protein [Zavarzinella sp.]